MQPNQAQGHLYNADAVPYILEWGANISTTTGAAQNIPKSGLITSDTATIGQYCGRNTTWITRMRVRFTGDAGNVAAQLINFAILVNGVAVPGATLSAGLATTAGAKTDVVNFTPFQLAEGDIVRATLTPTAGLTAGVTNVNVVAS